jgi:hypothetical protein
MKKSRSTVAETKTKFFVLKSLYFWHNVINDMGNSTKFSTILVYVVVSIILILTAISIILYLLTTKFPTHSDVFWIGVQTGALGVLSLIFLTFGLLLLYRVAIWLHKL